MINQPAAMAARPLLAPALLLALAVLLSGAAPSALASLMDHPIGDLLTKAGTANATDASPADAASPNATHTTPAAAAANNATTNDDTPAPSSSSNSADHHHAPPAPGAPPPPPPLSPEKKKEKQEKEKQRQEEEKRLEEKAREFGRVNHLVSHTNYTGTYKGIAREFVAVHNGIRARYGVPPMRWDKKLARHARRWATSMRDRCALTHSGGKYSESIYLSRNDWNASAKDAVNHWAKEEPIYDKLTGQCAAGHVFRECGHFAHIVKKEHQWVGCARSECINIKSIFVICDYVSHDPSPPKH